MEEFWILILVAFFVTNSFEQAESVQLEKLEELPLQTFDELFVEEWWDKDEAAEDLKTPAPTNFRQNVHHQIDRQNIQIGQIEPNSTDQLGQIECNSSDQNPLLVEHKEMSSNKNIVEDERKRKIVAKFQAIKDELKQKGKYSTKDRNQIERKIAKDLKVNRKKIYKWKKEFGLSRKMHNFGKKKNDKKNLVEKFDQKKAGLKRDGFKNSYHQEIDKTVAKELGLSHTTIQKWKRELGQTAQNKYPNSEQKELMKRYYEFKDQNPKIHDKEIAKMLEIGSATLIRWKRQFKRQQFHPNSVDVGHSVEENAAANVQEIGNTNSESV